MSLYKNGKKVTKDEGLNDVDFLNFKNADPETLGGKVVRLVFYKNNDDNGVSVDDTGTEPTAEEFERLGLDPEDLGCVDDHPEGSDRGGYVPTLNNGCYDSENAGEWES